MGKRILAQRKGQGNLWSRSPSHRHVGQVKYRPFKQGENQFKFKVIDFIHSPGRGAPVARIKYDDDQKGLWLPPEGIFEGDEFIQAKGGQPIEVGNILPLKEIPLGTLGYNIEGIPQDGGKFARASGVAAIVRHKFGNKVEFQEIDTSERTVFLEWGISDALFIDGKQIRTGPPPSYEKIRKKIARRIKKVYNS